MITIVGCNNCFKECILPRANIYYVIPGLEPKKPNDYKNPISYWLLSLHFPDWMKNQSSPNLWCLFVDGSFAWLTHTKHFKGQYYNKFFWWMERDGLLLLKKDAVSKAMKKAILKNVKALNDK
jgi:hypothetical protein